MLSEDLLHTCRDSGVRARLFLALPEAKQDRSGVAHGGPEYSSTQA